MGSKVLPKIWKVVDVAVPWEKTPVYSDMQLRGVASFGLAGRMIEFTTCIYDLM